MHQIAFESKNPRPEYLMADESFADHMINISLSILSKRCSGLELSGQVGGLLALVCDDNVTIFACNLQADATANASNLVNLVFNGNNS